MFLSLLLLTLLFIYFLSFYFYFSSYSHYHPHFCFYIHYFSYFYFFTSILRSYPKSSLLFFSLLFFSLLFSPHLFSSLLFFSLLFSFILLLFSSLFFFSLLFTSLLFSFFLFSSLLFSFFFFSPLLSFFSSKRNRSSTSIPLHLSTHSLHFSIFYSVFIHSLHHLLLSLYSLLFLARSPSLLHPSCPSIFSFFLFFPPILCLYFSLFINVFFSFLLPSVLIFLTEENHLVFCVSILQLLKDLLKSGFFDESDSFYLYHQNGDTEENQEKSKNCMKWCKKEKKIHGGNFYFLFFIFIFYFILFLLFSFPPFRSVFFLFYGLVSLLVP